MSSWVMAAAGGKAVVWGWWLCGQGFISRHVRPVVVVIELLSIEPVVLGFVCLVKLSTWFRHSTLTLPYLVQG